MLTKPMTFAPILLFNFHAKPRTCSPLSTCWISKVYFRSFYALTFFHATLLNFHANLLCLQGATTVHLIMISLSRVLSTASSSANPKLTTAATTKSPVPIFPTCTAHGTLSSGDAHPPACLPPHSGSASAVRNCAGRYYCR